MKKFRAGYTLIEVLVASAVVLMGIAAAAALSLTMVAQEEANVRVARALNLQEQAGRLYQLGLSPSTISSILPPEPNVVSLTFSAGAVTVTNAGTMDVADCELVFFSGSPFTSADGGESVLRTNELKVVRPSIR